MPESITLDLDTADFRRRIRTLTDREVPRVLASAMNKVAFEILDAEKSEVASIFEFAGPGTKKFFQSSFRFNKARTDKLTAEIFPRDRIAPILEEHQAGDSISGQDSTRLTFRGMLAIPVGAKRGLRGRVPKRLRPSVVTAPGGKGFVQGRVIRQRKGKKRTPTRILFALVPKARLDARFNFYRVARDTALREFPKKFKRVLEKIR